PAGFTAKLRAGPCSKPWSTGRMTSLPVPARRPWLSRRAMLVRVPGLSLPYQLRISFTRDSIGVPLSVRLRRLSTVELVGRRHVVGAAQDDGRSLVILAGHDVEHSLEPGARPPPRLLHDHAHGGDLVEQPELGLGLLGIAPVRRVHEQPAVQEGAVDVPHHRARVAERVGPAARLVGGLEMLDEGALAGMPRVHVPLVDAVGLAATGDADVRMGQEELATLRVEGEAVRALP